MDHGQFDELTRTVASRGGSRRAVVRLLAGGALAGLVARLGLLEDAEAKPKPRKAKPKQKRKSQAEQQGQGQPQAEGKGKGKKGGKKKPKPPRPPCAAGQKPCPDGSCIPDLPYTCCPGQRDCGDEGCYPASKCCPGQTKCPDGSCRRLERYECCPGQQSCGDEGCVPQDQCCPGERKCGVDGPCIREGPPHYECCPNERECGDEGCYPPDRCCPSQTKCPDGSCRQLKDYECCPGQRSCGIYECVAEDECCSTEKTCANGTCAGKDDCCPVEDPTIPLCANCYVAVCDNGKYVCLKDWVTSCFCPFASEVCPNAPARSWPLPEGGFLDLPNGCCAPGHMTRWDPTSGSPICVDELYGETGTVCFVGW